MSREKLSRTEIQGRIDDLESEIGSLEDELLEKQSELEELEYALDHAKDDEDEIFVGPSCEICDEEEPIFGTTYCYNCERRAKILIDMGKTPEQIAAGNTKVLPHIRKIASFISEQVTGVFK